MHVLEELALGAGRVAHDAHVQVASGTAGQGRGAKVQEGGACE